MKIGYTKKTKETKDVLRERMPGELRHSKIFLNIGNSSSSQAKYKDYLIINTNKAVSNSMDKRTMFKLFKNNKINSVRFIDLKGFGKLKALGYILIGRDLVLREQGLNVIGLSQLFNFLNSNSYCTIKENKVLEYRVIVFRNKLLRTMIKLPKENDFTLKQENCKFIEVNTKFTPEQKQTIIDSVKSLGLDLAGVDCLVNKKGALKIIEVNSGMSLCKKSADLLFKELKSYYSRMKTNI